MATHQQHCQDCIDQLGNPYKQVHLWLDELQPTLGPQHRAVRHNNKGIAYVRKQWGEQAAQAARIHIERDEGGFIMKDGLWITDDKKES